MKMAMLLALFLLAGILVSVSGGTTIWVSGNEGVIDHTNTGGNSIKMGWSPNNGVFPAELVIALAPLVDGAKSEMIVWFYHASHPNYTVTEALLTPFVITKMIPRDGNWSFANAGDNGSIIKTVLSADSGENPVEAYFEFTNLVYSSDHGQYQIILPLSGGVNNLGLRPAITKLNLSNNFDFYGGVPTIVQVYLSDQDQITSSYPAYSVEAPQPFFSSTTPLKEVYYELPAGNSAPVVIGFTNLDDIDNYQRSQNLGFLLLGIGIPLAVSSAFEFEKERSERGHL
ncbi:MAG: hypothetical protein KGI38_02430 [Thaumarchaeota archaeon]|nr:hypothetical protein [Nitrososphaerota archaeon]